MIMEHIEKIKKLGWTVLSGCYSDKQIIQSLKKIKYLQDKSPIIADEYVPRLNKVAKNLYNLPAKDLFFIKLFLENKELEKILIHFLNDPYYVQIPQNEPNYILRSLGARSTEGELPMHIDSFFPYQGPNVIAMQCILFLEDSTIENGCTINISGSHLSGTYADNNKRHLASPIEAKAGDLYIQDARLHHGTLPNITTNTRWSCVATYTRFFIKQHFDMPKTIPNRILKHLSPKEKSILGFCSQPLLDELHGADIKKGYTL